MAETFSKGLNNLKRTLENRERSVVNYMVNPVDFEGKTYASKRKKMKYNEMEAFGKQALKDIDLLLRDADLKRKGAPVFLIYNWDKQTDMVDAAFGIPIISEGRPKDVELIYLNASQINVY